MPKQENNALQKKFYNNFQEGTFSVECAGARVVLITHYHCMAKQICMITKHEMNPMQYAEIHALPYKYNVPLST